MKNPLADPQIVGVSSGAGLAGVIVLILFPYLEYAVPFIAFIGALTAAILVYALAWKQGIRPSRIILAGVAVAAFLGSMISAPSRILWRSSARGSTMDGWRSSRS